MRGLCGPRWAGCSDADGGIAREHSPPAGRQKVRAWRGCSSSRGGRARAVAGHGGVARRVAGPFATILGSGFRGTATFGFLVVVSLVGALLAAMGPLPALLRWLAARQDARQGAAGPP
jgi:hypothetical protein